MLLPFKYGRDEGTFVYLPKFESLSSNRKPFFQKSHSESSATEMQSLNVIQSSIGCQPYSSPDTWGRGQDAEIIWNRKT